MAASPETSGSMSPSTLASSDGESVESDIVSDDDSSSNNSEVHPGGVFGLRLRQCLDEITSDGTFANINIFDSFVNPGLYVEDLGLVALPLLPPVAKEIAQRSRQAPFGKGDLTLVDTTVRKTWELDASRFKFQNPAWEPYLTLLAITAVTQLGVETRFRAEPYKLLLYEEGAFFRPHKDTEKAHGMFGTLVICLPSQHEGGEVHLSHAGKKLVLETAPNSGFSLSALSWYADVTHEIKPITSGYRLVLTYNLVLDGRNTIPANAQIIADRESRLNQVLRSWDLYMPSQKCFIYVLEHQYTAGGLQVEALKGRDRALGLNLSKSCTEYDFYFFLANMTREKVGEDEEDYYEEEDSLTLSHIVTSTGDPVAKFALVEEDCVVQEDAFDRYPDSEVDGEFTGNESMPSKYRYHDSVIVLVPKECARGFFIDAGCLLEGGAAMMDFICHDAEINRGDTRLQVNANWIMNSFLDPTRRVTYHHALFSYPTMLLKVVKWSSVLGNKEITKRAIAAVLARDLDVQSVSSELARIAIQYKCLEMSWDEWFADAVGEDNDTTQLLECFRIFHSMLPTESQPGFKQWTEEATIRRWKAKQTFEIKDLPLLNIFCGTHDFDSLKTDVLPLIISRSSADTLFSFLQELLTSSELFQPSCSTSEHDDAERLTSARESKGTIPKGTALSIYRYIIQEAPQQLVLQPLHIQESSNRLSFESYLEDMVFWSKFLGLMTTSFSLGIGEETLALIESSTSSIIDRLGPSINVQPVMVFLWSYIPMIRDGPPVLIPPAKKLIEFLLNRVVTQMKAERPMKPQDWGRIPVGCGAFACKTCPDLDRFLLDPNNQTGYFKVAKAGRDHLAQQLRRTDCNTDVDKRAVPYTLVVNKTENAYQQSLSLWETRLCDLEKDLERLAGPWLQELLGGQYEALLNPKELWTLMGNTQSIHAVSQTHPHSLLSNEQSRQPLQPGNGRLNSSRQAPNVGVLPSVAGVKRKAESEVIDLT